MNNRLSLFKVNVKLYVLYCYMNSSCYTKVSPPVSSAVARLVRPSHRTAACPWEPGALLIDSCPQAVIAPYRLLSGLTTPWF